MDEADKLCDRIAIVDHGELKALDSPLKLKASIPGKNTLEVELLRRRRRAGPSALERAARRRQRDRHDHVFRIASRNGPATTMALMEAAAQAGITVQSLAVQSTTLDDVFVHYTGRALRDALQDAVARQDSPFMMRGRRLDACGRTWAIIERELRRFRRSPMLIVMSMVLPIVQLVVLGYAFGGNVKHLKVAVVDQDHGVPAVRGARAGAAASVRRADVRHRRLRRPGRRRSTDLRNGRVNGVLTIPPDFSRRVLAQQRAAGGADRGQHRQLRVGRARRHARRPDRRPTTSRRPAPRMSGAADARRGRGLSLRAVRAVPAAGLDRDVDLHDGDDRRRHHLHRRQGARAARRLSGHADHQARADRRLQHLRHDQGGARRACS